MKKEGGSSGLFKVKALGRADDAFDRPVVLSEADEELKRLLIENYDEEEVWQDLLNKAELVKYVMSAASGEVLKEAEALMANRATMAKTARSRAGKGKLGVGAMERMAVIGGSSLSPSACGGSVRQGLRSRTGSFCPNLGITAKDSVHHSSMIATELLLKGVLPKDTALMANEPDDVFLADYAKAHCMSHLYKREAVTRLARHQATISKLEEDGATVEDARRKAVMERGLDVSRAEAMELRVIELEADLQTAQEALERALRKKDIAEGHMNDFKGIWIVAGWNLCLARVAEVYPDLDQGELTEPGEQAEKEAGEQEDNNAMELALNAAYKEVSPNDVPPTPTFEATDSQDAVMTTQSQSQTPSQSQSQDDATADDKTPDPPAL